METANQLQSVLSMIGALVIFILILVLAYFATKYIGRRYSTLLFIDFIAGIAACALYKPSFLVYNNDSYRPFLFKDMPVRLLSKAAALIVQGGLSA